LRNNGNRSFDFCEDFDEPKYVENLRKVSFLFKEKSNYEFESEMAPRYLDNFSIKVFLSRHIKNLKGFLFEVNKLSVNI